MAVLNLSNVDFWIEIGGALQPTAPIPEMQKTRLKGRALLSGQLTVERPLAANFYGRAFLFISNAVQSAKISALSQELTAEGLVTLFELDLTRYGVGIARFTTDVTENMQPLRWGGNPYFPAAVTASGFERKSGGAAGRPTLTIANINSLVSGLIIEAGDLVGCEVRRYRTFRRFLDDGAEPSVNDHFPAEIWRIERKSAQNKIQVSFELAGVLDQEGAKIPKRQILRDYCSYRYRFWNKEKGEWDIDRFDPCPFAGQAMFTEKGEITDNPELDVCAKSISHCKLRFGENSALYSRAFPGAGKVS